MLTACGGSGSSSTSNTQTPSSPNPSSISFAKIVSPGSDCPTGGVSIDSGIDENGNGKLDALEIDQQQILCNGENGSDGAGNLLTTSIIQAGAICASGGVQIDSGLDTNSNGTLDNNEIENSNKLCNGIDGATGTVGAIGPTGATGATGPAGAAGAPGSDGAEGINSLIVLNSEPAGSNCPSGGVRIDAGGDNNRNNILDAAEIDSTRYLCGAQASLNTDIIYIANPRLPNLTEVFAGTTDGSGSTRIFAPLDTWTPLSNFQISPDQKMLSFLVYENYSNYLRYRAIYVVNLETMGAARKISATSMDVTDYSWSPDSSFLVGVGDDSSVGNTYFRVFNDGSGLMDFGASSIVVGDSSATAIDNWIGKPNFAPDGKHFALRLEDSVTLRHALMVVDTQTLNFVNVSDPKISLQYGDVIDYQWAPDGSYLAMLAKATTSSSSLPGMYTVKEDGSSSTQITGPSDRVYSFQWSPSSSLIGILVSTSYVTTGVELRTVTVDGSATFTLSGSIVTGGNVVDFQWSPNAGNIGYRADQDTDNVFELYSVSSVGVGRVKVSGTLISGGDVYDYAWAPDSNRIAFRADRETDLLNELYTVIPNPLTTPVPVKISNSVAISSSLLSERGVIDYRWAPDSSRIAIRGDSLKTGVNALSIAAPDASFLLDASGSMLANADVSVYDWFADSSKLVFIGDLITDTTDELFVVDANGAGRTTISTPLPTGSATGMFVFR